MKGGGRGGDLQVRVEGVVDAAWQALLVVHVQAQLCKTALEYQCVGIPIYTPIYTYIYIYIHLYIPT